MYVVNPDSVDVTKLKKVNTIIRNWLIYQKHFSVFGRSQDGCWYFVKTEALVKELDNMPFYLKLIDNFN